MQNKVRRNIFLYFLVLSVTYTSAQTNKTIVIDTLVGYAPQANNPIVQLVPEKGKELIVRTGFQPKIIISKSYPNVIIAKLDLNDIALLLDNKGGILKILSLGNIDNDTIIIDKWIVYNNGLTDTIRVNKAFFQMYNDSMASEPYKIEHSLCLKKNPGNRTLDSIEITVNNNHYKVPVEIITVRPLFQNSFQGYFPKKKYKSFIQKSENDKAIYRYKMFMGKEATFIQRFDATLEL